MMGSLAPVVRPPIDAAIPPLMLGTATFNTQYVPDPHDPELLPALAIVRRTLELGINGFDTSPYYGPSEGILGHCLADASIVSRHPRPSYFLVTKAGRIGPDEFDYSPGWVRQSVQRSLQRLHTSYLDLVYMHDVEFVTPADVLAAVAELRRLRSDGVVRYVGISGYPVGVLCHLAELVLKQTGEPLDAVLSYGHFTIQNTTLATLAMDRLTTAGVGVVLNASILGMGLLTSRGVDAGPMAAWHPSPPELRLKVKKLVDMASEAGESLEAIAIRWALDHWARDGASRGGTDPSGLLPPGQRVGVSVMGVSNVAELEQTWTVFKSVLDGLTTAETASSPAQARERSLQRRAAVSELVERMRLALGPWKDFSWMSPPPGFVNAPQKSRAG